MARVERARNASQSHRHRSGDSSLPGTFGSLKGMSYARQDGGAPGITRLRSTATPCGAENPCPKTETFHASGVPIVLAKLAVGGSSAEPICEHATNQAAAIPAVHSFHCAKALIWCPTIALGEKSRTALARSRMPFLGLLRPGCTLIDSSIRLALARAHPHACNV